MVYCGFVASTNETINGLCPVFYKRKFWEEIEKVSMKQIATKDCEEIMMKVLDFYPIQSTAKLRVIEEITAADWNAVATYVSETMGAGVSVTGKSIKALSGGAGSKNSSINILCAFLLLKEGVLSPRELLFKEKLADNRYYVRRYFELQGIATDEVDDPGIVTDSFLTNKPILLVCGLPFGLLILKVATHSFSWSNIVAMYFCVLCFGAYFKFVDRRMGFSLPVICTLTFLVVNTNGYFFSYVVMPNNYFKLNPDYEMLYYWGLTLTNIFLNGMAVLSFVGYSKLYNHPLKSPKVELESITA